jgi:hypothetical protein
MGRSLRRGRPTVEQTPRIDIRALQRADYFSGPKHDWWLWRINGNVVGEARIEWDGDHLCIRGQVIDLARTPCRFGGHRSWFRCACGRHVSTLYSPNGRPWACRHCYRLTYATRQASPLDRHLLRAQRIRRRLGGSPNMLEDFPSKPKGMHWRRYGRMRNVHDRASNHYLGLAARWVDKLHAGRGGADRPKP